MKKSLKSYSSYKILFLTATVLFVGLLTFYYVYPSFRIRTVVEERIYRSPHLSIDSLENIIKEKGIKTIINLRGEAPDSEWYIKESELSKNYNLSLYDCRLSASELPKYRILANIIQILSKSEKPILIHCAAGVDRTGFVSALALALEKDPPLSELKKQFSWRYGAIPFRRKIGPYFFSNYEQWLHRTQKTHSSKNLMDWIDLEYVDGQGNLEFYIDHVNGSGAKENFTIPRNSKTIVIEGWAFNTRTNSSAEGFYVVIDNRILLKPEQINRPDVAKFYGLKQYDDHFMVGWRVSVEGAQLGDGCHKISFRINKNEYIRLNIPTDYVFCFK